MPSERQYVIGYNDKIHLIGVDGEPWEISLEEAEEHKRKLEECIERRKELMEASGGDRQHVDDSDEYSQLFGIVIGHPPQCDLFREVEDGYELDATPNEELRELVDWWNGRAGRSPPNARIAFENCADELEQLIGDTDGE